jgi:hypothetical protein
MSKQDTRVEYEPVYQHGPDGTEETKNQNRDEVQIGLNMSLDDKVNTRSDDEIRNSRG